MKRNGTLSVAIVTGTSLDEYGEQVGGEVVWTEPYECLVEINSDNRKGTYEDGEFRSSAYTILIEDSKRFYDFLRSESGSLVSVNDQEGTEYHLPNLGKVKLERYGEYLGEFRIQSIAKFPSVGRLRMYVN